jgi:hypothetical protein
MSEDQSPKFRAMTDVEDHEKITCPWCRTLMKLDVYIAPVGRTEGMGVYLCPECDRTESLFIPPAASPQH